MSYDPDKHHRRSIRLKGYDYSQPADYFVTICVQRRECLFGQIANGEMLPNEVGRMIERWWAKLADKFPSIEKDVYVVMPNHFHGIVMIKRQDGPPADVGAVLRGRPGPARMPGHPHGGAPALGDMMDWFKTMTTNDYIRGVKERGWTPFQRRLWQRGYYEHIVRGEQELDRIREYVATNPARWEQDRENPAAVGK